jgi:hypothetical protein
VVVYLVSGPSLGLNTGSTVLNETFSEPSQGTSTVKYVIESASSPVNISVLDEGDAELILADFTHRGVINFDVSGVQDKTVLFLKISKKHLVELGFLFRPFAMGHRSQS